MIVMMIVAILFLNIFLCYVALNLLAMLLGLVGFLHDLISSCMGLSHTVSLGGSDPG